MFTQAERINIVQTEAEQLKHYLATLPDDAWRQPSACADWEVRDVLAHLTGALNLYRDSIGRGLQDDPSTPEGRSEPNAFMLASPEERQEMATVKAQRIISDRQRLGPNLMSAFSQACDLLTQRIANLGPHDWSKTCYHPWGLLPVRALVNAAVFELAIHGRDIRSALEPPAALSPEALTVILDHVADCLHWFFPASRGKSSPRCYRFDLTGAVSSQHDIVGENDTVYMRAAGTSLASATFRCGTETFVLLLCGHLPFDSAVANGELLVEGDSKLAHEFGQWLQGV